MQGLLPDSITTLPVGKPSATQLEQLNWIDESVVKKKNKQSIPRNGKL